MIWSAEQRQASRERASSRRQRRIERYRQGRPAPVRHFPHDPYRPRLIPEPARERLANKKLFSWQIDGINTAHRWYEIDSRPEEFRHYSIGKGRKNRVQLRHKRARSEKAELLVRLIALMVTAAQTQKGPTYDKYEVGSWRNGKLYRWTLPEIAEQVGEGDERPSIDQLGDAFNCLAAVGWTVRRQPKDNAPSVWKITRALLDALGVSKRFSQSAGIDPDLEHYLRQIHAEDPSLSETEEGRRRAVWLAVRRLREVEKATKARPPPT